MSTQKEQNETEERTDFEMDTCNYKEDKKNKFEAQQVMSSKNDEECSNTLTKQYNVQSLCDKNELIDCPDNVTDQSDGHLADDELIGDHETQLVETDLHKYLTYCTKNTGHKEFIPVESFSSKHLPEGHRDKDFYKLIKTTADLTVRVDVGLTSPDRPEFWPDTKAPYPFYDMRESSNLRTGSGRLDSVTQFTNGLSKYGLFRSWKNYTKCWCKTCKGLDSGSSVWWEFNVYTATHVVFDDNEASQTSLRLFYDSENSPVVSVDKVSVDFGILDYIICRLTCVTCDRDLGNKLDEMWKRYVVAWGKVKHKYQRSRDEVKLNFIVSHPHGSFKHVSVGHWRHTHHMGDDKYDLNFTHTNCPGSSGAHVHCVWYDIVWW